MTSKIADDMEIVVEAKEQLQGSDRVQKVTKIDELPTALRAVMHESAAADLRTYRTAKRLNNKAKRFIEKRDTSGK